VFAQQSLQPKLSRKRYASVSYEGAGDREENKGRIGEKYPPK